MSAETSLAKFIAEKVSHFGQRLVIPKCFSKFAVDHEFWSLLGIDALPRCLGSTTEENECNTIS
jgi:hypothetical protein